MIIFRCLTYRNIRRRRVLVQEHADHQLIKMILIQVILVVISLTPYCINNVYISITSEITKDADRQKFVATILTLVSYLYYIGNFYMFFVASNRFRQTVKEEIFWWRKRNQIHPSQTE